MRPATSALIAAILFTTLSNPCTPKPGGAVPEQQQSVEASLLEPAVCIAASYESDPSYLHSEIAIRYAGLGQFDRALELANSIEDAAGRDVAKARIATIIRKSGDPKRARQLHDSIQLFAERNGRKVPRHATYILGDIAAELAASGNFERVFELARSTDEDYLKRTALDAILDNLVLEEDKRNDFGILSKVIAISATLGNGEDGPIISRVAQKYAEADQYQKAITLANSLARTREDYDNFHRDDAIANIAVLLAKQGEFARAIKLAESTDDYFKSEALIQIAKEQIAKAQSDAGVRSLRKVTSRFLKDPYEELDFDDAGIGARRLARAAVAYARAGYRDKAENLLSIALDRARRVRKSTEQDQAIREVAQSYAEAGMFDQAVDAAQHANFTYFKIEPLAAVAIEMIRQNRHTEVQKVVAMIREARIDERSESKADGLLEIANEYLARREKERAAEIASAAFEIARKAPVNDFQPGILQNIAVTLAETGEYIKAIEAAAENKSTFHQVLALAELGVVQAKVGWVPDEHAMKILNGMIK